MEQAEIKMAEARMHRAIESIRGASDDNEQKTGSDPVLEYFHDLKKSYLNTSGACDPSQVGKEREAIDWWLGVSGKHNNSLWNAVQKGNMKALRIGALRRCTGRRWDTVVLHYNAEFGTAAVEGGDCEIASVYEKKHRLKGGELGGADGRNALQAGPGVLITATSCVGSGDTALPTTQVVDEDEPAQGSLQFVVVKGATGGVYPIPTTRYKKGHKVIAIGYSEADNTSVVSPGVIDEESANENSFTVSCTPLGPGSFIVDMETPNRVCGVVGSDGTIISAKDPSFIVNWVTHALPALVPAETTRFSPEVMQYINDVKRSIVKNQEYIPTMSTCQRIFVKNSIEDFKYFML